MTTVPPTIPHGLYRMASTEGAWALVNYGTYTKALTEHDYWCAGYEPRFGALPTKEEYELAQMTNPAVSLAVDRTELLHQLKRARKRVVEARARVKSNKEITKNLGSSHEDFPLADAYTGIYEERLKLRIVECKQLEKFLKNLN
jgi:hypothetical protein